jgi:hypothetical protein
MNFPAYQGYSGTGTITSANSCFTSATITTSASFAPIEGSAFVDNNVTSQVLLYVGATFSATEYANGWPALTITLPSSVATTNRQFYVATNESNGSSLGWTAAVEGPVTASNGTITFSSGGGNVTFDAGQEELLAVYSQAAQ